MWQQVHGRGSQLLWWRGRRDSRRSRLRNERSLREDVNELLLHPDLPQLHGPAVRWRVRRSDEQRQLRTLRSQVPGEYTVPATGPSIRMHPVVPAGHGNLHESRRVDLLSSVRAQSGRVLRFHAVSGWWRGWRRLAQLVYAPSLQSPARPSSPSDQRDEHRPGDQEEAKARKCHGRDTDGCQRDHRSPKSSDIAIVASRWKLGAQ
jgi:hypothetical protein